MPKSLSATQSINTIEQFLEKVAEASGTIANTEPETVGGMTEHPSKKVDDSTEDAEEGSRSKENEQDVKEDYGGAAVVGEKGAEDAVNPGGTAAEDAPQIGTKKAPTGEDPANETASVKSTKDDPAGSGGPTGNSTHPARTDNDELDGQKYAEMSLEELTKVASSLGNEILSDLATAEPAAEQKEAADLAGQAGWELAGLVDDTSFDKQAADAIVQESLEDIIKEAFHDADNVAAYLANYKEAMEAEQLPPDPNTVTPEALEEAAAGMPQQPEAGGEEQEIAQLIQLMEQLGITPEELEAALQEEEQGGEAVPPEAAAAAADAANAAPGMEVEAAVKQAVAETIKELADAKKADTKTSSSKSTQDYIKEILERS